MPILTRLSAFTIKAQAGMRSFHKLFSCTVYAPCFGLYAFILCELHHLLLLASDDTGYDVSIKAYSCYKEYY